MLYVKDGFPEVDEVVFCFVKEVNYNNAILKLEEYDLDAILIISEVSAGRIRNIRDHIQPNKKIVCKVLRVDEKTKRIDLSLRRVNENQKKLKLEEIKKEEFSQKFYKDLAKKLECDYEKLFEKTYSQIFETSDSIYDFLVLVSSDSSKADVLKLDKKEKDEFVDLCVKLIKKDSFVVKKTFKINSFDENGINKIKDLIKKSINEDDNIEVKYLAPSKFEVNIENENKKKADNIFNEFKTNIINFSKQFNCSFEF